MASIIGVETLQHTNGTTAATIDSNGHIIRAKRPHVFVSIEGSSDWVSHSADDAIKFNTVVEGDTSLFNTTTHKFTCPVDGLYMVGYAIHSNTSAFQVHLMRNTTELTIGYQSDGDTDNGALVIDCDANDELWIKTDAADNYYRGTGTGGTRYTYATFSLLS